MFITVCANPVLDLLFVKHERQIKNRHFFSRATMSAGGFGANAARALRSGGESVVALMSAGGDVRPFLETRLAEEGVLCESIVTPQPTRFASIELDGKESRMQVSPSPRLSPTTISRLFDRVFELSTPEDVILVGGSVPASAEEHYLQSIAELCHERPFCCCDVRASGIEVVLAAKPRIIRLPDEEARSRRKAALRSAVDSGAELALCSHGPDGLWAQAGDFLFRVEVGKIRPVNPFGAGDCLIAMLAVALFKGVVLVEALRSAVAAAAASLITPVPGHFEPTTADQILQNVRARRMP